MFFVQPQNCKETEKKKKSANDCQSSCAHVCVVFSISMFNSENQIYLIDIDLI